jgi:aspartate racemase
MRRQTVGILGGMGPHATVDFYGKVVEETAAATDQEHLKIVIWADPTVPDRTRAVLHGGHSPLPWLVRGAARLEALGADLVAMPCNTAHVFLPQLREVAGIPLLDMVEESALAARNLVPDRGRVGLLATNATVHSGLYHQRLTSAGITVETPDNGVQDRVMRAIHTIKSGRDKDAATAMLRQACRHLLDRGVRALIAACTEIPLALDASDLAVPVLDPTRILAQAVVARSTCGFPTSKPTPNRYLSTAHARAGRPEQLDKSDAT